MHTIEACAPPCRARNRRTRTAVLVAGTILAATVAPVSAIELGPNPLLTRIEAPVTAFHHHFWRGVPGQNRPTATKSRGSSNDDLMAITGDRDWRGQVRSTR